MEPVKLHHPVPTRQTYVPEPPSTPASPHDYMRFSSNQPGGGQHTRSPPQQQHQRPPPQQPQQQQQQPQQTYPYPPQQASYPAYPQPGQPGGQPGVQGPYGFMPAPTMWGMNDATAQLGMQLGQSAVQAGSDYVKQNFGVAFIPMSALKHQFQVSNLYVLHKLRLVLFPWRHKPWYRKSSQQPSTSEPSSQQQTTLAFLPPRDDINSPDLYIPSMALVTYVLLSAVRMGLQDKFNPRILGATTSSAVFCVLIEVMLVRLACYLLNIQGSAGVVDLVAYAGYKFVGVITTILTELATKIKWLYWAVFFYVFLANALFLVRSLRYVVLPENSAGTPQTYTQSQRSRRVYFLIIVAACQLPLMFLLVS